MLPDDRQDASGVVDAGVSGMATLFVVALRSEVITNLCVRDRSFGLTNGIRTTSAVTGQLEMLVSDRPTSGFRRTAN